MSESRNHINQYNAVDIQRYLDGKMSAAEMHAFEKASLDDPFLADAIEGMESVRSSHGQSTIDTHLTALHGELQERRRGGAVVPMGGFNWRKLVAAAVILVVLGTVAYTTLFNNHGESNKENLAVNADKTAPVAENAKADSPASIVVAKDSFPPLKLAESERVASASEPASVKAFHYHKDSMDLRDKDRKELAAEDKARRVPAASAPVRQKNDYTITPPSVKDEETVVINRNSPSESRNQRIRGDSISIIRAEGEKTNPLARASVPDKTLTGKTVNDDLSAANEPRKKTKGKSGDLNMNGAVNFFNGRVTDNNNQPIANASVLLLTPVNSRESNKKMNSGYVTDQYGYFLVPSKDSAVQVTVNVVGYAPQTVQLRNDVAINQVQLAPSQAGLNEVVITGSGKKAAAKKSSPGIAAQYAEPVAGWLEFEKYLGANKKEINDNGVTNGEVIISFYVGRNGELSGFAILQSLSPLHDGEAVRLIKQGPAWRPLKGRKGKATVTIRF